MRWRTCMHRLAVLLLAFASVSLRAATANQQAKVVKDAQAIAEVQASLLAMGASAVAIQDSVSSGTLTTDLGKGPVSVAVTIKSKGTQMSRVELQKPSGTSIRILNHGT